MTDVAVKVSASTVSTVLPSGFSAVGQARDLVRRALKRWHVESLSDDVTLVASELVSNALLHGVNDDRGRVEINLVSTGSHLICAVSDPNPEPPVRRDADESDDGGRGLQLIEALSLCWGWTPSQVPSAAAGAHGPTGDGKSVWAIFPLDEVQRQAVAQQRPHRPAAVRRLALRAS